VLSDTELFLAKLLHHFMRVTYYNTHEITTTEEDEVNEGLGPERLQVEQTRMSLKYKHTFHSHIVQRESVFLNRVAYISRVCRTDF
jgi:hypothetical protein